LVDKKLHSSDTINYLQSVDYRYTIRNWLQSINNSQLTNDSCVTNDDTNDYFGMSLLYNTAEAGFNNQAGDTLYFNGDISAIKWKGQQGMGVGNMGQNGYKFTYDRSGRMKTAKSRVYGATAWDQEMDANNETLTYDNNGNIRTLLRNQRNPNPNGAAPAVFVSEAIDNLTYTYGNSIDGNRLTKVEDATNTITILMEA